MNKPAATRVAVYIRIGGTGDFQSSFEMQKIHFNKIIGENPDWEFIGFYADLGMDSRNQPNLQRLIADCKAGRIDLIITKSTSRVSRSLNVLMGIVRELAYLKPPVGIYFEDTQMNTLSKDSFLFLSMFEAMAIHESDNKRNTAPYTCLTKYLKAQKNLLKDNSEKEEAGDGSSQ